MNTIQIKQGKTEYDNQPFAHAYIRGQELTWLSKWLSFIVRQGHQVAETGDLQKADEAVIEVNGIPLKFSYSWVCDESKDVYPFRLSGSRWFEQFILDHWQDVYDLPVGFRDWQRACLDSGFSATMKDWQESEDLLNRK